MAKTIKEIIIMLLICLILMLIFAILLYDYIPNRKTVKQVTGYTTSQEVEALLEDNIDSKDNEVVRSYEVTSSDLSTYAIKKEYVKGKSNPFASIEAYENEVSNVTTNSTENYTTQDETKNTTNEDTTQEDIEEENSSIK